jgi:2-C-methyl-D-erythritol 2,4-cyclodiphosphate synthase
MRIGTGYDAHRLKSGRKLILGGVEIEFEKGLDGHSDADVLSHAIADAMLGAISLGDIGMWFPDTDNKYKDISSLIILSEVSNLIDKNGYEVENIDSILVLQNPKVAPYIDEMRENISKVLEIDKNKISIKATSTEGMGFEGKGEGISAYAVVLLKEK